MSGTCLQSVGRYELRRELGRGVRGVVYEAFDPDLARRIALRILEPAPGLSRAERALFEQRFVAEARTAAKLGHPNIALVHDVGRDSEDVVFMALEFLEGPTLAEVVGRGGPLPWPEALRVTARVASALGYARSKGVAPLDVGPGNIVLVASGQPKIMDFGPGRRLGDAVGSAAGGTPRLLSGDEAGPRGDVVSLGRLAFFLLTGRSTDGFEGLPRPSSVVATLPAEVDRAVGRALGPSLEDAYRDCLELEEGFEDVLKGDAAAAAPGDALDVDALLLDPVPRRADARAATNVCSLIETLVPEAAPKAEAGGGRGRTRPKARQRLWPAALAKAAMGAALLLAFASGTSRTVSPTGETRMGPAPEGQTQPTHVAPAGEPRPSVPARGSTGRSRGAETRVRPARLSMECTFPLETGRLRVWVDDKLLWDQELRGELSRKVLGISIWEGSIEHSVEVAAGRHEVRAEVDWQESARAEAATTTLEAGSERRLRIHMGRLRKGLTLEWQT